MEAVDRLLGPILLSGIKRGSLSDSVFRSHKQGGILLHNGNCNHGIVRIDRNATDTCSLTTHRSYIRFQKTDAHAAACDQNDLIISRGQLDVYQLVPFVNGDRYQPTLMDVGKVRQGSLFDGSLLGGEKQIARLLPCDIVAVVILLGDDPDECRYGLPLLELQQIRDVAPL